MKVTKATVANAAATAAVPLIGEKDAAPSGACSARSVGDHLNALVGVPTGALNLVCYAEPQERARIAYGNLNRLYEEVKIQEWKPIRTQSV